jgi:predicted nucleic acid-binding protein
MTAPVFVDTNVLVYCWDTAAGQKQAQAQRWETALWESGRGRLSSQILNEFYITTTRKLSPGLPVQFARQQVLDYAYWCPDPAPRGAQLQEEAWRAQDAYSLSYWDALVVAAAWRAGAGFLLTEDLNAGQSYGGLVAINPFQTTPEALGL